MGKLVLNNASTPSAEANSPHATAISLLLAIAVGALFFYIMLPFGPWAQSDTVDYVQAARHLVQGRGLTVYQSDGSLMPLSHFPPGYPLALATAMALGLNWVAAARLVSALAAGLLTFLLARSASSALRRPLAALLALPVIALLPVARLLAGAMSEPPYFVLQAIWVLALWRALSAQTRRARMRWLVAAGFAVGLGTLIRYAGLHAWLTLAVAILLLPRAEIPAGAIASYAPPAALFGAWKAWLALRHAPAIGRLNFHLADWLTAAPKFFAQTAQSFILPWGAPLPLWAVWLFWAGIIALTVLAVFALLRSPRGGAWFLGGIWLAEGLASFPFMLASYAAFQPTPALDWRIYAPAALALAMGLLLWGGAALDALAEGKLWRGSWLARWQEKCRGRGYFTAAALLGIALLAAPTPQHTTLKSVHSTGLGYTSQEWYTLRKELLPRVAAFPPQMPIVSNARGGLILWIDRPAAPFASLHNHTLPPAPMGTVQNDPAHRLVRRGAAFVLIWADPARQDLAWWGNPKRMIARLIDGLHICYQTPFGGIYFYTPPPKRYCQH